MSVRLRQCPILTLAPYRPHCRIDPAPFGMPKGDIALDAGPVSTARYSLRRLGGSFQ